MTIEAKIIEDSIGDHGVRLTTMQLRYPRFIHAEFMTHRVFSRNASSSRAIPVDKIIQQVIDDCAMPVKWGKNQPGMQADEELDPLAEGVAVHQAWLAARDAAVKQAKVMVKYGAHKQIVNRILEPFAHISVIVTATEWDNFFNLRCHSGADPTFQALAESMRNVMNEGVPTVRSASSNDVSTFHLPYISLEEKISHPVYILIKCSAARCARVSYLNHDGSTPSIDKDLSLYDRLVGSTPLHASPVEHQAFPYHDKDMWCNNFRGWNQYRYDVEHRQGFTLAILKLQSHTHDRHINYLKESIMSTLYINGKEAPLPHARRVFVNYAVDHLGIDEVRANKVFNLANSTLEHECLELLREAGVEIVHEEHQL